MAESYPLDECDPARMIQEIRNCYISAPAGTNLDTLRGVLASRRINVVVPDKASMGSDWHIELNSIFSKVDLVIGVLTRERRSEWVLFELGVAWAKHLPIVLLAPSTETNVSPHLQRFLIVRTNIKNREAISFALDQLLAAPEFESGNRATFAVEQPSLGGDVDILLQQASRAIKNNQGPDLEHVMARVFRKSGVELITQPSNTEHRPDFAIWSDALQPTLGNPLLVEIKTRIGTRDEARKITRQLSSCMASSGTSWGLLLYGDSPLAEGRLWSSAPPNVLVSSIASFFEGMRDHSFNDFALNLRNRRVHGGRP